MLRKGLRQLSIVTAMAVLTASFGVGSTVSAASITNTGPGSKNIISFSGNGGYSLKNNNNVGVDNSTNQNAHTGDATVGGNSSCWWGCNNEHENDCNSWEHQSWSKKTWQPKCHVTDDWSDSWESCSVCSWNPCNNWQTWGGNTNGGSAKSGHASNSADTNVDVSLNNDNKHQTKSHGSAWGGNASIENTGPHSTNIISSKSGHKVSVTNNNDVDVDNNVNQSASSGNATVSGNTNGGNATTGNASNHASLNTEVEINNSSLPAWHGSGPVGSASIDTTGPGSLNKIYSNNSSSVSITNNNDVDVDNNVNQSASSGNATVSGNTHGGNATTGDASNHAEVNTVVSIRN